MLCVSMPYFVLKCKETCWGNTESTTFHLRNYSEKFLRSIFWASIRLILHVFLLFLVKLISFLQFLTKYDHFFGGTSILLVDVSHSSVLIHTPINYTNQDFVTSKNISFGSQSFGIKNQIILQLKGVSYLKLVLKSIFRWKKF